MRLPSRAQYKRAFCFFLSLSFPLYDGVDLCGGHQYLTPSVTFTLHLCLSLTLRVGVDCWVLAALGGEGSDLKCQVSWALDTWEV